MVSLLFVVLYQLIRQMRLIKWTLDRHVEVDIFRPGPLHAFPRLMATSGASLVLLAGSSVVPTVTGPAGRWLVVPSLEPPSRTLTSAGTTPRS